MIHTRICDLLGIDHPIVLGGMVRHIGMLISARAQPMASLPSMRVIASAAVRGRTPKTPSTNALAKTCFAYPKISTKHRSRFFTVDMARVTLLWELTILPL